MECGDSPSTLEFYGHVRSAMAHQRLPVSGSIELTFRCNLRCAHCYVGDSRSGDPGQDELSTAEVKQLLDELAEAGVLWLLLTGGDPFVRPDFLEIYQYARRKGFITSVFTNGTLLTPQICDSLAEFPPRVIEISLYGATAETYERVTGIPGSFGRCLRGINLLRERGLNLKLKTMVMNLNMHEMDAMRELARSLEVPFRSDPLIIAQLDHGKNPLVTRLTPEQVVAADIDTPGRVEAYQEIQQRMGKMTPNREKLYYCQAGQSSFHIDPYGKMSPCMVSRFQSYDLRAGSFREAWEEFLPRITGQPRLSAAATSCDSCKLYAICGQCPGWASLEHGDPGKKVDYLCQVAHLRAKTFGLNA